MRFFVVPQKDGDDFTNVVNSLRDSRLSGTEGFAKLNPKFRRVPSRLANNKSSLMSGKLSATWVEDSGASAAL